MTTNTRRTIRRHIAHAGYSAAAIRRGLEYAATEGASTAREGYILAMSRILYRDGQLEAGDRFSVEVGSGPRA